ncbi:MAG: hypothetical protein WCC60_11995 [Ilumatobacteraceae bacterium]
MNVALTASRPVDQRTMVQLLRRNATVFQTVFAVLWSVRFTIAVGAPEVIVAVAVVGGLAVRAAFRATRGPRARDVFRTPPGKQFLRPVTWLTVAQIAGSVVLPGIAGAIGAEQWVMPLVAATIGLFLVGFARPLQVAAVARTGAAATVVPMVLPLVCTGDALLAWTAVSMMVALLTATWACALATRADVTRRGSSAGWPTVAPLNIPSTRFVCDFTQRSHSGNGDETAFGQDVAAPSNLPKEHRGLPS